MAKKDGRYLPFIETHAAIDEWLGMVVGLFWLERCILGVFVSPGRSRQIGMIIWNVCIGIWKDTDEI